MHAEAYGIFESISLEPFDCRHGVRVLNVDVYGGDSTVQCGWLRAVSHADGVTR